MDSKLDSFAGHRVPAGKEEQQASLLQEMLPFLPDAFDDALPLYVTIGLLMIVVSRAARRKMKARPYTPPSHEVLVRRSVAQSLGSNPELGAYGGYWGDAESVKKAQSR
ncbi:MAG: hypothetical protein AAGA87_08460 [Pseudomonadota bacterium]